MYPVQEIPLRISEQTPHLEGCCKVLASNSEQTPRLEGRCKVLASNGESKDIVHAGIPGIVALCCSPVRIAARVDFSPEHRQDRARILL